MNRLFPILLTLAILSSVVPALPAQSPKISIVSDDDSANTTDFITAELSGAGLSLFERTALPEIIDERTLDLNRLGAFVPEGSDAVILLEKNQLVRILSSTSGIVLHAARFSDLEALSESLRNSLDGPIMEKLKLDRESATAISVVTPAARFDPLGNENQQIAVALGNKIAEQLANVPGVIALERDRLDLAASEQAFLTIDQGDFWTSSHQLIVTGLIEGDEGHFEADTRLVSTAPDGGLVSTKQARITGASLDELASSASRFADEALKNGVVSGESTPFSLQRETVRLTTEAEELLRQGQVEAAEGRIDAALAINGSPRIQARLIKLSVLFAKVFPHLAPIILDQPVGRQTYTRRDGKAIGPITEPLIRPEGVDGRLSPPQRDALFDMADRVSRLTEFSTLPPIEPRAESARQRFAETMQKEFLDILEPTRALSREMMTVQESNALLERLRSVRRGDNEPSVDPQPAVPGKTTSLPETNEVLAMGSTNEERIAAIDKHLHTDFWDSSEREAQLMRLGTGKGIRETAAYAKSHAEKERRDFWRALVTRLRQSLENREGIEIVYGVGSGMNAEFADYTETLVSSSDPAKRLSGLFFHAASARDDPSAVGRYETLLRAIEENAATIAPTGGLDNWTERMTLTWNWKPDLDLERFVPLHTTIVKNDPHFYATLTDRLGNAIEEGFLSAEFAPRVREEILAYWRAHPENYEWIKGNTESMILSLGGTKSMLAEAEAGPNPAPAVDLPEMGARRVKIREEDLISYRDLDLSGYTVISKIERSRDHVFITDETAQNRFFLARYDLENRQWDRIGLIPETVPQVDLLHVDEAGNVCVFGENRAAILPTNAEGMAGDWLEYEISIPAYVEAKTVIDGEAFFWTSDDYASNTTSEGLFSVKLSALSGEVTTLLSPQRRPAKNILDSRGELDIKNVFPLDEGHVGISRAHELWDLNLGNFTTLPMIGSRQSGRSFGTAEADWTDEWTVTWGSFRSEAFIIRRADGSVRCLLADPSVKTGEPKAQVPNSDRLVGEATLTPFYTLPPISQGLEEGDTIKNPAYYEPGQFLKFSDRLEVNGTGRAVYCWPRGKKGDQAELIILESVAFREADDNPAGTRDSISPEEADLEAVKSIARVFADEDYFYLHSRIPGMIIRLERERLSPAP